MTQTNRSNPTWQCPVCKDIRYQTIKSEKVLDPETLTIKWRGKVHICRGCSVMFQDPYLFNLTRMSDETANGI